MHQPITTWWGKLDKDPTTGEVRAWHPLLHHSADVAAVAHALLTLPTWNRRLARLCELDELSPVHVARLAVLAALHDVGKFNHGFQRKGIAPFKHVAGHVTEALTLFRSNATVRSLGTALGWPQLEEWGIEDATCRLWIAAIGHHGQPTNLEGVGEPALSNWDDPGPYGHDAWRGVKLLGNQVRSWLPNAFDEKAAPFPESTPLQHAFAGLVMLADWLGSDRREDRFPFSAIHDPSSPLERWATSQLTARNLLREMGLDTESLRPAAQAQPPFEAISEHPPRPAQRAMLRLPIRAGPSITVLEAETGSGKTEAALAHFMALFAAGEVDGMYLALPTRTSATQMHERVVTAARRAFGEKAPPVVLAVPGYLRVDDQDARRLPGFEVLWPDHLSEHARTTRHRGWAVENSKRYMAGTIVVGTVDQALLAGLMVQHSHLRATALLRHLLVVDEVHSSDAYMTAILQGVLAHHQAAGGHALLMSATLGERTRSSLLWPAGGALPLPAAAAGYPVVVHVGASGEPHVEPVERDSARERRIQLGTLPILELAEEVAKTALVAAESGAAVLVVRNSVKDAVDTQSALETLATARGQAHRLFTCNDVPALHHGRFAGPDRVALDAEIQKQFGKGRLDGGRVAVATQTIQQSLDLDADFMLTDLCPVDVLLQRLGRLHRHIRSNRPDGFASARAMVLVPAERDLGVLFRKDHKATFHHGIGGEVYEDLRMLEATWRQLESSPQWSVPAMCRAVVEACVDEDRLGTLATELGEAWVSHGGAVGGAEASKRRMAELGQTDWDQSYAEMAFPSERRIMSRLGVLDRRVELDVNWRSPLGGWISEMNIRAAWCGNAPADAIVAERVRTAGEWLRFEFGDTRFVYDRWGLRKDDSPSEVDDDHT